MYIRIPSVFKSRTTRYGIYKHVCVRQAYCLLHVGDKQQRYNKGDDKAVTKIRTYSIICHMFKVTYDICICRYFLREIFHDFIMHFNVDLLLCCVMYFGGMYLERFKAFKIPWDLPTMCAGGQLPILHNLHTPAMYIHTTVRVGTDVLTCYICLQELNTTYTLGIIFYHTMPSIIV